ncbi:hypothetical protein Tco_0722341 [Tanacetum coccineum]
MCPGPESQKQAPPQPIYIPFVPELYTHRQSSTVAYSADQDHIHAYIATAMDVQSEPRRRTVPLREVAKRFYSLTTPLPSPLFSYSSPLPQLDLHSYGRSLGSFADILDITTAQKPGRPTTEIVKDESYIPHWMMHGMTLALLKSLSQHVWRCDTLPIERTAILIDERPDYHVSLGHLRLELAIRRIPKDSKIPDRRKESVITELLKADHRRQRHLVETLKIVKSLKTQMIELQDKAGTC